MLHYRKSQLLSGAASLSALPVAAPERKDDDVATLTREVKTAVEGLDKTVADFRTKNDERLKQIEKKQEDVVTKAEVDKINKAIDDAIAKVKAEIEGVEAKANRLALGGGGPGDTEAKAAAAFAKLLGKADFNVEAFREYKQAMDAYLRRAEQKAATTLAVGTDPAGGYLVTPDTSGRIVKKVYESSPMRQVANVVQIGTDQLEGPIDNGEMDAQWIGEKVDRAQTDAAQFGKWVIAAHELYAYPWVTQRLLEDANIDVEAWIAMKAADKFARKETTAFYIGDGQLKPQGVLTYPTAATGDATRAWGTFEHVLTGNAGAYPVASPADVLLSLIFKLKAVYRQNAKFQMSRATMGETRKLKDGQGNYLVDLRLRDGALVETMFGFQNLDAEDMPALADNSLSIGFGDWAETYTIVDRLGVSVIRDNITKPGFVKFHMRKRVGGGAVNFESAKFLKFH